MTNFSQRSSGPLAAGNVWNLADLERRFGDAGTAGELTSTLVGKHYRELLDEMVTIVDHQWSSERQRGLVRGFLLTGPPGTGKTTLAQALAYEASRRQDKHGGTASLAVIDGSEIARARYGESESRIREIFERAQLGFSGPSDRTVLLFDDVESILMARGTSHAREWHFSQDSVFFHAVDALDSSRVIVVMTSNRPDLVDAAIRDRFMEFVVNYPGADVLVEIAKSLATKDGVVDVDHVVLQVRDAADAGHIRSLRDVERYFLQVRLASVLGRPSLSENRGSRPDVQDVVSWDSK